MKEFQIKLQEAMFQSQEILIEMANRHMVALNDCDCPENHIAVDGQCIEDVTPDFTGLGSEDEIVDAYEVWRTLSETPPVSIFESVDLDPKYFESFNFGNKEK